MRKTWNRKYKDNFYLAKLIMEGCNNTTRQVEKKYKRCETISDYDTWDDSI